MKNLIFTATATPAGFAMPSAVLCCSDLTVVRPVAAFAKARNAHAVAAVRQLGSHSWTRLRSPID